jgi:hypothetical protein
MTESQMRAEVKHLHQCVEELKKSVAENAVLLEQVRDILASFRVVGVVAKWVAAIGAAATAVYHGVIWWRP